jgi:transposase
MFFDTDVRRIYAFSEPVDMRKSFDGLLALLSAALSQDTLSGDVYVFVNRCSNYIKCIYWDRTGYCLFAKRLERGKFKFPLDGGKQELTEKVFKLILDGICLGRRHKTC